MVNFIYCSSKLSILFALLCIIILFVIGYEYFLSSFIFDSQLGDNKSLTRLSPLIPLVLAYTTFFGSTLFTKEIIEGLKNCEYQCEYVNDRRYLSQADIIIFHSRDFSFTPVLLINSKPNSLKVFYSLEAAPNENITSKKVPPNFFNATLTFRRDSTIWRPYDTFEKILPNDNITFIWTDEEVQRIFKRKSKLILQMVSNCVTHSKREEYVTDIQKYTNLTIFGSCNNQTFTNWDIPEQLETHFFYLAFENAVCDDYITEKFWRIKNLIIPVVLKRSILNSIVENDYFIAADDFASPKELVEKLKYLSENPQEYLKYFGWTKKYTKSSKSHNLKHFCKICEISTKKEKHIIDNIYEWWENSSKCKKDFAKLLINK